jgi:hypothetical protein
MIRLTPACGLMGGASTQAMSIPDLRLTPIDAELVYMEYMPSKKYDSECLQSPRLKSVVPKF